MSEMYYVLYSSTYNRYVNEDGEFDSYANAEKFDDPWFTPTAKNVKWVGPCKEGDEP